MAPRRGALRGSHADSLGDVGRDRDPPAADKHNTDDDRTETEHHVEPNEQHGAEPNDDDHGPADHDGCATAGDDQPAATPAAPAGTTRATTAAFV